ncbi:MAG: cyclic nucleotide-binding domain-containing protein [Spirochaetia bacterium]|nr:cyclic nucleotide-binding domain-containing protein [Spirochaetia bacterium]
MEIKISISKIPFFKFVTPGLAGKLKTLFKIKNFNKDDVILKYGQDVPGFYIIVQGDVLIQTERHESVLAHLKEGQGFGEMSLVENQKAAANVKATEDKTKLLFCEAEDFKKLISDDFVFAAAFYKGASTILSERLRKTNLLIETEMDKTRGIIKDLMEAEGIVAKLAKTRVSIDGTGENLISKLTDTLPVLNEIELKAPEYKTQLDMIKNTIKKVVTVDSQNFDIISQQVERIHKYLINMHRLLEGEDVSAIQGDQNIFSVDLDKGPDDSEEAITFF